MKLLFLIALIIVAAFVIGVVSSILWVRAQIKHNLESGCRPIGWNQWQVPTAWVCPGG